MRTAFPALVLVLVLLATSCTGDPAADQVTAPTLEPTPPATTPPSTEPPSTPTPTPTPTPTATPTPAVTAREEADEVVHIQQRLNDLSYYVGAIDGEAGPATASAVGAFQKVNGLTADGVVGPNTRAALEDPASPSLRGGPANRIEVDLDTQVLYLVEGGQLVRILPISSGSGETYTTAGGGTARSVTPVGTFSIERRIEGVRNAPLGILYDPLYFHRGWAIHGSGSVPAYPASHGCVRVTRADARWLFDRAPVGTTIIVYGSRNAFDPGSESAGTSEPAGDTPDTTPPDGIQTEEPSSAPAPTPPPTAAPTASPTAAPTTAPTAAPTTAPTASPAATTPPATSPAPSPEPTGVTPQPANPATTPQPTEAPATAVGRPG